MGGSVPQPNLKKIAENVKMGRFLAQVVLKLNKRKPPSYIYHRFKPNISKVIAESFASIFLAKMLSAAAKSTALVQIGCLECFGEIF